MNKELRAMVKRSKEHIKCRKERFSKALRNITRVKFAKDEVIRKVGFSGKQGDWVKVRPCADEYKDKTYLGVLLGDLALSTSATIRGKKTLEISHSMYNPAIYIPDTKTIVMGCGSWWGSIDKPEDLKEISDKDIDNVWYVKALKDLSK